MPVTIDSVTAKINDASERINAVDEQLNPTPQQVADLRASLLNPVWSKTHTISNQLGLGWESFAEEDTLANLDAEADSLLTKVAACEAAL